MYNPYRAEHMLILDGKKTSLRMTLGALAALEASMRAKSLQALIEVFATGQQSAQDVIHVLNAGLYGAGHEPNIEHKTVEGGAIRAAQVAMELLNTAFPKTDELHAL